MYTKDKLSRITLRLNDEQFDFVKEQSDMLGVSPSEFLRMVINSALASSKKMRAAIDKAREVVGRENDKTDSNYLV